MIKHPDSLLRIFAPILYLAIFSLLCVSFFGSVEVHSNSSLNFQELYNFLEQLHNYKPRKGHHILGGQGTAWETFNPETFRIVCTQQSLIEGVYRGKFFLENPVLRMPLNYAWEVNLPKKIFLNYPGQENYAWVTAYLLMIESQIEIFQSQLTICKMVQGTYLPEKENLDYLRTIHDMVMAGKSVAAREHILINFLQHPANYLDFVEKLHFQEGTFKNFIAAFDNCIDFNYKLSVPYTSEEALTLETTRLEKLNLLQNR